jgi:hypothetical protein
MKCFRNDDFQISGAKCIPCLPAETSVKAWIACRNFSEGMDCLPKLQ